MLAQCGIPTVLLYLGFIDDDSWLVDDRIKDGEHWEQLMKSYFSQVGAEKLLDLHSIFLQNNCTVNFCIGSIST
jgi:hypothetical protein